jgi:hypothetical protein
MTMYKSSIDVAVNPPPPFSGMDCDVTRKRTTLGSFILYNNSDGFVVSVETIF